MKDFTLGVLTGVAAGAFSLATMGTYTGMLPVFGAFKKPACEAYKAAAETFDAQITANGERVTVEIKKDDGTPLCKFQHAPKPPVSVPAP